MPNPFTGRPRAPLFLLLALATALARPAGAAAQQCTEEPCEPFDFYAPVVSIFPGTGSMPSGGVYVEINWSDNYLLNHASRQIV
ncbi:MAG TPA: hypothetical protein VHG08_01515, partial [Longimicrobium sp.]|nr:hypothetical protein [Longimicrobium sp.]